ncbi:MAG: ABC transporter ATP-binding protein [Acidobacteria bacterium]|nr:ABC transporter ATP-binding protein [Acidobacteriota bacterium]
MTAELAIETTDLRKVFRNRWSGKEVCAVENISLRVNRGTTFGLLGPNGAGKTTFVKMLLSACIPTAGTARVYGKDTKDPEARRPIGYLPENHRFPTYFTGAGMLDFYAALSGVDSAKRRKLIPELFERVGLDPKWMDVRVGKYSKGMLQRVGLAQALIHSPTLLVLDEPSDGVDPVGRRQIRDVLHALEAQGVTIFLNSHLLQEVELFCRDVAIVNKGRVVLEGAVSDLTAGKGYKLVAMNGSGPKEWNLGSREEANGKIDDLRREGFSIESLVPTTSRLEDVFIEAVQGKK